VITYADELDWEAGTVVVEFHDYTIPSVEDDSELAFAEEGDQLFCRLTDMCFDSSAIEMMAPGAELPRTDSFSATAPAAENVTKRAGPGRRREYDWDGALLHLIGQAEKNSIAPNPDAHGAQADIKRRLADWFSLNGGKVPADSQLQALARRALDAIKSTEP